MSTFSRKILRVAASAVFALWIGYVAGGLISAASSTIGVVAFFGVWVVMTYLLYRYYHRAILFGSAALAGAILCLLIPLFFLVSKAGSQERFAGLAALVTSSLAAVVLAPIGLVLAYIGYRLTAAGIDSLKSETNRRPQAFMRVQSPIARGVVFCRSCGNRISPYDAYCPICGQKQRLGA